MTNYEFMHRVEKAVEEGWKTLNKCFNRNFPLPRVDFDLKGMAAGMAYSTNRVSFNLGFVKDGEEMISQVVPHELAHAWCYIIRHPSHVGYERRRPHGPEWAAFVKILGGHAARTHKFSAPMNARNMRRWNYDCPGCGKKFVVSTRRHNQIQRRGGFCPSCRTKVVLK